MGWLIIIGLVGIIAASGLGYTIFVFFPLMLLNLLYNIFQFIGSGFSSQFFHTQIMMMTQQYRSKELCLGFGIQEKAGVETGLTKSGLLATLINNTTNFFIHRIREQETVEAICSVVGTKKHLMETEQTFADTIKDKQTSGQGTMRIDEEFIWHPNTIKRLGVGEIMFTTISKKLDPYTFPNYKPIVADVVESRIKVDNVVKMINNLTYKG